MLLRIFFGKFARDRIMITHADVGREVGAATDNLVPITFGKDGEVIVTDAIAQNTEKNTCIEIVTRAYGAYRVEWRYTIVFAESLST